MSRLEKARELAKKIQEDIPIITRCHVDDWDRDERSFTLFATFSGDESHRHGFSLKPISAKIKSILRQHSSRVTCPKKLYTQIMGHTYFQGYDGNSIEIDLTVYNS